jgi:hypothetical protein
MLAMFLYATCVIAIALGGAIALGAGNIVKRLIGLIVAHCSAALLLALLESASLALGLLAALAVEISVGAALCARIAEDYGTAESDALAGADFADEDRG